MPWGYGLTLQNLALAIQMHCPLPDASQVDFRTVVAARAGQLSMVNVGE
jgi:hypothetical protein